MGSVAQETFVRKSIEVRVGHQKQTCVNCHHKVPIEILSKNKSYVGWCMFCAEHFGDRSKQRSKNILLMKVNKTMRRHSDRMRVSLPVLRDEYGWSSAELVRMLEKALREPCPYCLGLRYGPEDTPMNALPLDRVSLDLYLSGEPYLANMKWCCALCNNVKRNLDIKTWQLYCTYYPKWRSGFGDIKRQERAYSQSVF